MGVLVKQDGTAAVEKTPATAAAAQTTQQQTEAAGSQQVTAPKTTAAEPVKVPETARQQTAMPNYNFSVSSPPTAYEGKYDQQLADLYNSITQRQPFSYDASRDDLYQEYVQRYEQLGNKAMMDTMGQAAALTGGYGNSYGQRVGQQTYDEYMTGLNDKATEMYQLAYQRYRDEGDTLSKQYGMLGDLADKDYGMYTDAYNKYMAEAALRGQSGDFEAYKAMWGEDAAKKMQAAYASQVLMPQYLNGQIDAETYKSIAGVYPVGYVEPGTGGGGDSGGSAYWDAYNAAVSRGWSAADSLHANDTYRLFNPGLEEET